MISRGHRVPVVLQMEAAECGAACLAMVLGAHGRQVSLEEARIACATSRDGVDAARLIEAGVSFGLAGHGLRREPADLAELPLPAVLHWNFDHFVVLERVARRGYLIVDPAVGRRWVDRTELGRSFTGVVLAFAPGPGFVRSAARRSTLGQLVDEAFRSKDAIAVGGALGLLEIVPAIALAGAIGAFTDQVAAMGRQSWSLWIVAVLAATCLAQVLIAAVGARVVAALRAKVATHIAVSGFWRALHLPISFFAERSAGEIVSRLRLGSELGGIVAGPLARMLPDFVAALGFLAVLAALAPPVALAVACVAGISVVAMIGLSRRVSTANAAWQVAEGAASGAMIAGFDALATYKLHGREQLFIERQAALEDVALDREQRVGLLRALAEAAPAAFGLAAAVAVLAAGAWLVMDGSLTLGGLIACQLIAGLLNAPVVALAGAVPRLQEAAGAFARIDDLARHPLAHGFAHAPRAPQAAPATPRAGRLVLDRLSFAFDPQRPLFSDVSLALEPGRVVAIMGPSGAGKSTVARICAGFETPAAGRVLLGDLPLQDWTPEALRQALQYVPQQAGLFSASIDENVTLWAEDVSHEAVETALRAVGLQDLLHARAGGAAARLAAHAPALSGGEVQRLALARALARRPAVIVLDEATSALDAEAEAGIFAGLRALGATAVVVTHRLDTAARCDEVYVLEPGGLVRQAGPSPVEDAAGSAERSAA
ncbi:MAG: cysteine peptidase family C39 domain-containing protein [Hyphomicrobiaceae bacterium]|nr:cysteine peptidase family C39 domain-containing protein [Hyphomicrobiaceae bacterium]